MLILGIPMLALGLGGGGASLRQCWYCCRRINQDVKEHSGREMPTQPIKHWQWTKVSMRRKEIQDFLRDERIALSRPRSVSFLAGFSQAWLRITADQTSDLRAFPARGAGTERSFGGQRGWTLG